MLPRGLSLTPHFSVFLLIPEALLDDVRSRAASFGAVIRPRIFSAPDVVPADEEAQEIATPEKASPSSSSKKPAVVEHSDYQTMFLRTRRPKTGVLEFALAARIISETVALDGRSFHRRDMKPVLSACPRLPTPASGRRATPVCGERKKSGVSSLATKATLTGTRSCASASFVYSSAEQKIAEIHFSS